MGKLYEWEIICIIFAKFCEWEIMKMGNCENEKLYEQGNYENGKSCEFIQSQFQLNRKEIIFIEIFLEN